MILAASSSDSQIHLHAMKPEIQDMDGDKGIRSAIQIFRLDSQKHEGTGKCEDCDNDYYSERERARVRARTRERERARARARARERKVLFNEDLRQ